MYGTLALQFGESAFARHSVLPGSGSLRPLTVMLTAVTTLPFASTMSSGLGPA